MCVVQGLHSLRKASNMSGQHDKDEMGNDQLSAEPKASEAGRAKSQRIEAYGTKGWNNTSWRRTFASAEKLARWCEQHDATLLGTRPAD